MTNETILGSMILVLLAMLVASKKMATGSIFDRAQGTVLVRLVNWFNLFFLLVVNPLTALLLLAHRPDLLGPVLNPLDNSASLLVLEVGGLLLSITGYFLMAWALITLGRTYQLGGSAPRSTDRIVLTGPYHLVRHPMYTAALCIALGLTCLTGALICLAAFIIYLVLILALIPIEEAHLLRVYRLNYETYKQNVKKLVPLLY